MTNAVKPLLRFCAILAVVALGGAWFLQGVDQAAAQAVNKPKPVDGRKTVISGIKSYEAGRLDTAIATLTKAISGGGLSSQDLAKALYYRGLAHQRSEKSAQAISDLTSAAWMKSGLSPSEKQTALAARAKAYAAVGVNDPGAPAQSIGKPAPAPPPARSAPAPAKPNQVAAVAKNPPQAATPRSSGFQTQVTRSSDSSNTASAEPAAPSSSPLSGVGGFFSNIFGGGTTAPASQPPASASTPSPITPPAIASPPASAPAKAAPRVAMVETPAAMSMPAQPAPAKPVVSAPVQAPFETTLSPAPSTPPLQAPRVTSAPASASPKVVPKTQPVAPSSGPLSGVGSFFSNIFGGGTTAPASQPPASTSTPSPIAPTAVASPPASAPAKAAPRVAMVETPATMSIPAQPAPAKPVVSAPVQAPFETTLSPAPSTPPLQAPRVASAPASAPATQQTVATAPRATPPSRYQPLSNKGVSLSSWEEFTNDTVGSLYTNVFGGGGSSNSASNQAPAAGPNTAVSAWSSGKPGTGAGPTGQPQGVPATTGSIGGTRGGYKIQVADVRSLGEAERLAFHLRKRHAAKLSGRVPNISEKLYGNMGTFYQVTVGPFAKTSETTRICAALKTDGFDCLVLKN